MRYSLVTSKRVAMAKTLPYENLDVDASEKTIQFLLTYSKATAGIKLENDLEELEFLHQN